MSNMHVALLRGINVGGNKKVDMAGLRVLMEEQGYADVRTLLNSGNVVFTADRAPSADRIEKAIKAKYGFEVAVILRSAAELHDVVAADPFGDVATDGSRYFVSFLDRPLRAGALAGLDPATYAPQLLHVAKRELYTWLPEGIADSMLMKQLADSRLGVTATARNWNTVHRLLKAVSG